ncbi:MAG: hypothetical protein EHM13_08330 [Acidobacteria bacterium]|nr:MAG: hypothetical protein EHM13_08330 [Acidobacteriota bacterium]
MLPVDERLVRPVKTAVETGGHPSDLVLAVAVLSVTTLAAGSVAAVDSVTRKSCTTGDARSNFEAPLEHIIGDFSCQYRIFLDGRAFTYCEDDVILGGVVPLAEYKALGWSRERGIADLERSGDRVWVDGVEQSLMRMAYKDGQHPVFGRAFITQLPVGDHVSYWEGTLDGGARASRGE